MTHAILAGYELEHARASAAGPGGGLVCDPARARQQPADPVAQRYLGETLG